MITIAFISHKGGVGKSTLAIHLAVQAHLSGLETLLVDLDSISRTASEWGSIRQEEQPLVVTAEMPDIAELYQQAKEEKFDFLILDCPPYLTEEVLEVSRLADCTILPVPPRFPELQSLSKFVDELDSTCFVVLNSCVPDSDNTDSFSLTEVRQMLEEHDIQVSPVHISRLDAFTDSLSTGTGVFEYEHGKDASGEIQRLLKWINDTVSLREQMNGE
jgi:chromosome partitioning protein